MSDKYNFDLTPLIQSWQPEVEKHTDYNSWTHRKEVFLGNGETPPLIIIPLDRREHPSVSLYCHGGNAETKDIYQVVNSTGQVPHVNRNAQVRVWIGKPPGSERYHLMSLSEAGMAQTAGMTLTEIRTQQERQITPDRVQEIRLKSNGTLIPDFIGGKLNIGETIYDLPSGTGADLTSHVPGTTNKERWVLVGVDETGAYDVVAGSEVNLGTSSYQADSPKTSSAGFKPFMAVKLANGDTETQDANMMALAGVATFSAGGGGSMSSFDVGADTGTDETVEDGDVVTIAGGVGLSSVVSNPATVTLNLDNTAVTPNSYTLASITVDAQGRITAASNGTAGTMSSFTLAGDSGSSQTIADGNTATIAGGTGIETEVSAPGTITISAVDKAVNQGRLTLQTGVPVPVTNVTAATSVYWTPFIGNAIALYDGTDDHIIQSGEVSLSLSGLAIWQLYDIFGYYNVGALALEANAWNAPPSGSITGATNATPIAITSASHGLSNNDIVTITGVGGNTAANGTFRITNTGANTFTLQTLAGSNVAGSGAYTSGGTWVKANYTASRATDVTDRHTGYLVKNSDPTRRWLGTLGITNVAGQSEDSLTFGGLWNTDNQVPRSLKKINNTDGHTYTTAAYRVYNNDFANRFTFVTGKTEASGLIVVTPNMSASSGITAILGSSVNNITNPLAEARLTAVGGRLQVGATQIFSAGLNIVWILEFSTGSTSTYNTVIQEALVNS